MDFKVGDWVYGSDWCYGQIVDIHKEYVAVEYSTERSGGLCHFEYSELQKADPPDKREFVEYVCVMLYSNTNFDELEEHLFRNGYDYGIDRNRYRLFVFTEELSYVETILEDRNIGYEVRTY